MKFVHGVQIGCGENTPPRRRSTAFSGGEPHGPRPKGVRSAEHVGIRRYAAGLRVGRAGAVRCQDDDRCLMHDPPAG